jgi:hypothetical protein
MPWINLTLRRGALPKPVQHAMMAKLTEVLMRWEKVPDTPAARKFLKGWVFEVADKADYNAGSSDHDKPSARIMTSRSTFSKSVSWSTSVNPGRLRFTGQIDCLSIGGVIGVPRLTAIIERIAIVRI